MCYRQEAGPAHLKVFELSSQRHEEWQFTFDQGQYLRQAIWTSDEKHLLLHPSGTSSLHVMSVCAKPTTLDYRQLLKSEEDEDRHEEHTGEFTLRDSLSMIAWSVRNRISRALVTPFSPVFDPLLEKKPYLFSLQFPSPEFEPPLRKTLSSRVAEPTHHHHIVDIAVSQGDMFTAVYSDGRAAIFLVDAATPSVDFGRELQFLARAQPRLFRMQGRQVTYIDEERDSINFI